ncbi:MAG: D-tyrosyl-tRNA(Tyr) deacylase [Proteobacteria bacterium]|nr:D-tyrosyl-tRNA(Tyr) deacylase [Pseudomonadota bacterium]
MLGLIQRVSEAQVAVSGEVIGKIDRGLLLLLGVQKDDAEDNVARMLKKVVNYRVFPDDKGHMNLSLLDINGELLVVPQFTIVADTKKGLRPSFSTAAPPVQAQALYEMFVTQVSTLCSIQTGIFGADMKVSLTNDGPVTFILNS